ncbi:MAG TPA: hypothetical protein VNI01_08490, partial [Elusimicrobiota bacterium]|nr:hypothetical protein [Elusimicrobiota bacterium]
TAAMLADKVYFFRSSAANLYDVLDAGHPDLPFLPSRMGDVLAVFRLDSDYLARAFTEGGARNATQISIDFDEAWARKNNGGRLVGIPYETFLSAPLRPFDRVRRRIGLGGWRIRRDEETLAAMRYLEEALTARRGEQVR